MKLSELTRAIEILTPHYHKGGDGYYVGAEHDQIYLYATQTPLSEAELKEMDDLGWFQEYPANNEYDLNESWTHFT